MEQFLNFHTHNSPPNPREKGIYNLLIQDIEQFDAIQHNWISVGIHPWYILEESWDKQLMNVEKKANLPQVLAIGECGLDRLLDLDLDKQLMIFEAQVKLAERIQKPVIIHCVRAFNELLQWAKRTKTSVPLIVHGFNNKPQIAQQLLAHGFYLSLGTALLKSDSNALKALKLAPIERLFLENDDRATPIAVVYEAAASILDIPVLQLKNQIRTNFAEVFNFVL